MSKEMPLRGRDDAGKDGNQDGWKEEKPEIEGKEVKSDETEASRHGEDNAWEWESVFWGPAAAKLKPGDWVVFDNQGLTLNIKSNCGIDTVDHFANFEILYLANVKESTLTLEGIEMTYNTSVYMDRHLRRVKALFTSKNICAKDVVRELRGKIVGGSSEAVFFV